MLDTNKYSSYADSLIPTIRGLIPVADMSNYIYHCVAVHEETSAEQAELRESLRAIVIGSGWSEYIGLGWHEGLEPSKINAMFEWFYDGSAALLDFGSKSGMVADVNEAWDKDQVGRLLSSADCKTDHVYLNPDIMQTLIDDWSGGPTTINSVSVKVSEIHKLYILDEHIDNLIQTATDHQMPLEMSVMNELRDAKWDFDQMQAHDELNPAMIGQVIQIMAYVYGVFTGGNASYAKCKAGLLSVQKNHDYQGRVFKMSNVGIIEVIQNKIDRLLGLVSGSIQAVDGDKKEDEALDIMNYCAYLIMMNAE